jgi:hypothetical protein
METQEQFEEWRDSPLTQAVLRSIRFYQYRAEEQFKDRAWSTGGFLSESDQMALVALKARAEMAEEIAEMDFETFEEFQRG